ncbi:hypothetical protein K435DRAFT_854819 [Dendrothele bispora CBS 962.96]|uniref:Uncharacterized protein n=1 Tax=Dendrothele bispora (strain CBS 962.96) TaxID=1314807 RepID=A0A4S8MCS0_DENBC|nr:hypothetical protein K435DRAFT_854806 [Dendrothele bispora CBS 962.96]THV00347.1 hypothetical protein K435DRAFT_854819 [Dendrothele bispora CBS 962.96]
MAKLSLEDSHNTESSQREDDLLKNLNLRTSKPNRHLSPSLHGSPNLTIPALSSLAPSVSEESAYSDSQTHAPGPDITERPVETTPGALEWTVTRFMLGPWTWIAGQRIRSLSFIPMSAMDIRDYMLWHGESLDDTPTINSHATVTGEPTLAQRSALLRSQFSCYDRPVNLGISFSKFLRRVAVPTDTNLQHSA